MTSDGSDRPGIRGSFDDYRLLGGFMDDGHIQQYLGTTLATLNEEDISDLETDIQQARHAREDLPEVDLGPDPVSDIPDSAEPHLEDVRTSEAFKDVFDGRTPEFGVVDMTKVCAFQPQVKERYEVDPPGDNIDTLLPYCLPVDFQQETQARLNAKNGGADLTVSCDSPNVVVEGIDLDEEGAHIRIGAKKNWIQVAHLGGRAYLKNGYHRVFQLASRGVTDVPAVIIEAEDWNDAGAGKDGFFSPSYLEDLNRPPLVTDFLTNAAITVPRRRQKKIIRVEVDEFKVPV